MGLEEFHKDRKNVLGKRLPGPSSRVLGRGKETPDKTANADDLRTNRTERKINTG